MTIDNKTASIIAQMEAAALQVFQQYGASLSRYVGGEPLTLFAINHKRPDPLFDKLTIANLLTTQIVCSIEEAHGTQPERPNSWRMNHSGSLYLSNGRMNGIVAQELEKKEKFERWMEESGAYITIQGEGYRMKFPKWEIFGLLEQTAKACDYPTAKLIRYAA